MKPISRIFILLLLASASYVTSYAQENQSYILHTIEKGQNLYSISKMYNVTTTDIIRLNPGCEEKIYAGQTIKIPQGQASQKGETFHTIQAGETLYKLTTLYKVSAKAICDANPGLSAENFRIGQVIRIPLEEEKTTASTIQPPVEQTAIQGPVQSRCKDMHKVKRKETIFSVSREYGISEQELIAANPELKEGMKKGQFLCIPYPNAVTLEPTQKEDLNVIPPSNSELFNKIKEAPEEISTIKAALILPFHEEKRMVEYYEGFLMAIDSLKRTGTSIDLYVYESGKDASAINNILSKKEMQKMNIIFGPMHQQHIKPLSDFAQKNDIRLVIPFSQNSEEVFNNPSIYQINTPQSYLYSKVYEHFTRQFPNAHVIFIEPTSPDKDKAEFIKGLKQELKSKGISMNSVSENDTKETLKAALRSDKENIFIPTSGSNVLLIKTLPQLTMLVREAPDQRVHLFGYPEWQTYTLDHLEKFFELDVYFYSSFYMNTLFPAAIQFTNAYHKWYSKDLTSKYPNYAMLGFDTGFFFLKGLSRFGSELENNLPKMNLTPIQTGFLFERVNNWGGFINKKVFFIHFTKNFELEKLDFE
ncbi:LysM domain-containing protein [Bacteroides faecichinchillae]|uniref:LysM domain-containing protein n=1 Tax=Bacteroides faecichinchillae TaxID=871325 RepID=A0A1M4SE03_9BACE|nr:LysM peptidoglycan-binding domain-containing protein [Bacteroides faecichinchillae]THG68186.1 LysM peptidoglycan-binding domain-containing protein [Bacteroides faecichinchillae]SHE30426.1 LysM domain-containing protein [Bacteroides faecichinchillae]